MKNIRILIVENTELMREALQLLLEGNGFAVNPNDVLRSSEQAMRRIDVGIPYDLIITELDMPGVTGINLLKHAVQSKPETKGLLLGLDLDTSYGLQCQTEAKKVGVLCLEKPINPNHFNATIQKLLL